VRIAVVGPTHPFKGGVAAHTTVTAHRLAAAGHRVDLVSWSRLYPRLLYPGEQTVAGAGPDVEPYPRTVRPLRWDRPGSWWRTGRRLACYDLVVLVAVVPAQVPALLAIAAAARRGRIDRSGVGRPPAAAGGGTGLLPPRILVLAHNVVPHETHPGGGWLISRLLTAADGVVVHSAEQAELARAHGAREVRVADLPLHPPGGLPDAGTRAAAVAARRARVARISAGSDVAGSDVAGSDAAGSDAAVRVLALGFVRRYKGFDLLLRAAAEVPRVHVTVAGEVWAGAGDELRAIVADERLAGRVQLCDGYVPGPDVPGLLAAHDVLALPYRHATASQNVQLGHAHGLPVLATRVGTFADQLRDGVDGLLVEPDDVAALIAALRTLTEPGRLAAMVDAVPPVDVEQAWARYVEAFTAAVPSTV
jgi:glycosyltransferase involved in cell wall biosynthesis